MEGIMISRISERFVLVFILLAVQAALFAQPAAKTLVLQEMTWTDVRDYLAKNDMVILPLGSTEQHGPQLPLGTDFLLAMDISKLISARTGVVVAPVLLAGYSIYHSGFPGTLSLKSETVAEVLFETAQMLLKYGFRRFLIFNYHGGNSLAQQIVIQRINQETEAIAVAIGVGGPLEGGEDEMLMDWHAGVGETSLVLYLEPQLVHMDRAEKPVMHFTPQMEKLAELAKKNPDIKVAWDSLYGVPADTRKGGSSGELSSNGVWSSGDPKTATPEKGQKIVQETVDRIVKFIAAWDQAVVRH
jgi:creatinine amidohydrolase